MVLAGKEYGTGSSRDYAAKGPYLQGVRAVIAESFERIHRSNLVGMGILPLQFKDGQNVESLGLTGKEVIDIVGLSDDLKPRQDVTVKAKKDDGSIVEFTATVRIDTPVEVEYYRNGGILHTVLRKLVKEGVKQKPPGGSEPPGGFLFAALVFVHVRQVRFHHQHIRPGLLDDVQIGRSGGDFFHLLFTNHCRKFCAA